MNKKEYFSAVDEIVKKSIAARIEAQTALDEVNEKINNRRKFSAEYVSKTLVPMRNKLTVQLGDAVRLASDQIEKLTANYVAELEAESFLGGGALTDDAKLLSVGVRLRESDLEKMFDRSSGNPTMQRLIVDYAHQHDMKIDRTVVFPNAGLIQTVKQIPYVASKCVSQHKRHEFYEQFMGENSELARYMNS